jgi:hypothetical protein
MGLFSIPESALPEYFREFCLRRVIANQPMVVRRRGVHCLRLRGWISLCKFAVAKTFMNVTSKSLVGTKDHFSGRPGGRIEFNIDMH